LLAAGARLDLKDTQGRTPIEHHKYSARDHIAKFLVNHQRQTPEKAQKGQKNPALPARL